MVKQRFDGRRIVQFSVVVLVLVLGLFLVNNSRGLVSNFKVAYLWDLYLPILNYKVTNTVASAWDIISADSGSGSIAAGGGGTPAAESVPVLTYHRIVTEPDGYNLPLNQFLDQMFALKKAGYQTVSLGDFYEHLQSGKALPSKPILLTFDDGRTDGYYPVDPLLQVLDYQAVMFVIAGQSIPESGEPVRVYLSKRELLKMADSWRWEIQSHSVNGHGLIPIDSPGNQGHFFSHKKWLTEENRLETEEEYRLRIRHDLVMAKGVLEEEVQVLVNSFAYPFGDYGQASLNYPQVSSVLREAVDGVYQVSFHQGWDNEPAVQRSDT